ncbi:hypothetical protein K461DRAFT_270190 [Myriangium duriaei CBS 260.36]|uniref:Uncharacterized protein n=1 Tax=Myriangium duriaei CBS 260.36 TaxID=1168546 RepID=A0A9P4MF81_9PEZI|nr:hypothetical protein K461DRAFT_270190 [Myriangium duriaei CBS 260.36]
MRALLFLLLVAWRLAAGALAKDKHHLCIHHDGANSFYQVFGAGVQDPGGGGGGGGKYCCLAINDTVSPFPAIDDKIRTKMMAVMRSPSTKHEQFNTTIVDGWECSFPVVDGSHTKESGGRERRGSVLQPRNELVAGSVSDFNLPVADQQSTASHACLVIVTMRALHCLFLALGLTTVTLAQVTLMPWYCNYTDSKGAGPPVWEDCSASVRQAGIAKTCCVAMFKSKRDRPMMSSILETDLVATMRGGSASGVGRISGVGETQGVGRPWGYGA